MADLAIRLIPFDSRGATQVRLVTVSATPPVAGAVLQASSATAAAWTSPRTGYTNAMTGTADRATAYATTTITLEQLARRVKAMEDDLLALGVLKV